MKRTLLFLALTLNVYYGVFAQSSKDAFNVVNKLKNYISSHDPEKAYLQFDKPYYAAGDTIYFKAYVTQGGHHKLSTSSGVLHVELINIENKIDQSIRLKLDSGVCWGDFALPDSLSAGNYRIRAYTQWMQNMDGIDFFDQPIPVGSLIKRNNPDSLMKQASQGKKDKEDLQFFPEGGSLVEGVRARVAFKATGTNGLGTHVKGVILDKTDKTVCSFESSHLGMGYFVFIPEKGNVYRAKLSFDDGSQDLVDLPRAESSGISLSLIDDSLSALSIRIMTNSLYYQANQDKEFLLVIYSGGKAITYSYKLDVPILTLNMERKLLQTGVSTISLFSQDREPMCERLFFVQNNDQLRLQIQTDKTVHKKKEKVDLQLNAKTPADVSVNGHFSMTIIDESQMPADEKNERNILTDLLLTSDLKGYVEEPNDYFKDTSEEARKNLDLLMLTQGYRHFEWKQVLGNDSTILTFQPEKGLEINGKITNLSDKPISDGTITLIPSNGGPLLSSTSDRNGLFHFSNLVFTDTAHLVLSAVNAKGGNSTRITYFNTTYEPPVVSDQPYALPNVEDTSMLSYFGIAKKIREEMINYYGPGKFEMLKPVTVKGIKLDNQYRTQSLAGAGHADQVMHADEIGSVGGQLSTSLNGRLRGVYFIGGVPYLTANGTNSKSPMLLVIDGTEIRAGSRLNVDDIPPSQVETVEVLKYASISIYGMDGAAGVLIITTKNGSEENKYIQSIGVLPITPMGFYKARTFYSPKYDNADGHATEPELRSTIYWNPEIKTGQDGPAIINYYNANSAGTYKIIVEGIDENGNIGRLVYRYQVE
jgi:hypothetical protein